MAKIQKEEKTLVEKRVQHNWTIGKKVGLVCIIQFLLSINLSMVLVWLDFRTDQKIDPLILNSELLKDILWYQVLVIIVVWGSKLGADTLKSKFTGGIIK